MPSSIGLGVGVVCLWGVTGLKKLIRADDSLDVFGVHAVGGIFGALMTGIFNAPFLGGPGSTDWVTGAIGYPGVWTQFRIQLQAVLPGGRRGRRRWPSSASTS